MVLGHHLVFTGYGFWLPNDPRGSWSAFVASWDLFRFGRATKTQTRVSVAGKSHNKEVREEAKSSLRYPPVEFNDAQIAAIATGFADSAQKGNVTVWACAIMPDHVHMVIARHTSKAEMIINFMKGAATKSLLKQNLHPFQIVEGNRDGVPMCWAAKGWKVFLDSEEDIERAIRYVENNPVKDGKPAQQWSFVTPFSRNAEGVRECDADE